MKTLTSPLKQLGISLLEVLLSLAIISIILVMAMQYFTNASNNQRLNMVRTFIGADMAAIQGFGVNNDGFKDTSGTTVNWQMLLNSGYLSKDTKSINCGGQGGCQQKTPWGDAVSLDVAGNVVSLGIPLPDSTLCNSLQESYGSNIVRCNDTGATVYINGYTPS